MTKYYSFDRIEAKNAVINMIVGGRGIGKSWGRKVKAMERALRGEGMFIYMRRFHNELVIARELFLGDIQDKFSEYELEVMGDWVVVVEGGKKRKLGRFVALSQVHQFKSGSFDDYRELIFDEFIPENNRHLPSEYQRFLSLLVTADRGADRIRCYLLGNSETLYSPYLAAFGVHPEPGLCRRYAAGFAAVHIVSEEEELGGLPSSRLGRYLAETEYGTMALGNSFKDGGSSFVGPAPKGREYWISITVDGHVVHLYKAGSLIWVSEKSPKNPIVFARLIDEVREGVEYYPSGEVLSLLRRGYSRGAITFDSPVTRERFVRWIR